jgi:hypothetical protein
MTAAATPPVERAPYRIMRQRCVSCIAPEGFVPSPDTADFKALVDAGKLRPEDAVWSCKETCTHRNLCERPDRIMGCRGSAIFFGVAP